MGHFTILRMESSKRTDSDMAIPIVTTHVTIKGIRPQTEYDYDAEGYPGEGDPPDMVTLVTEWPASITMPTATRGNEGALGADDSPIQVDTYAFRCDVTDIQRFDIVVDESNGTEYRVVSIIQSLPVLFGLEHMTGQLKLVKGAEDA